jgi:hypothetical protein
MLTGIRSVAERAQLGRCQLLRPVTEQVMDPVTLEYTSEPPQLLGETSCRYQSKSRAAANVVPAGEQPMTLTENQVTIPITAPTVKVGDLMKMTTTADPRLLGRVFRIVSVVFGEYQAERHLMCEDNETRPQP